MLKKKGVPIDAKDGSLVVDNSVINYVLFICLRISVGSRTHIFPISKLSIDLN